MRARPECDRSVAWPGTNEARSARFCRGESPPDVAPRKRSSASPVLRRAPRAARPPTRPGERDRPAPSYFEQAESHHLRARHAGRGDRFTRTAAPQCRPEQPQRRPVQGHEPKPLDRPCLVPITLEPPRRSHGDDSRALSFYCAASECHRSRIICCRLSASAYGPPESRRSFGMRCSSRSIASVALWASVLFLNTTSACGRGLVPSGSQVFHIVCSKPK
jgi:hypothetical protein